MTIAEAEAWEVLLLLDNREVRTKKDRDFLKNQLVQAGVECDVRNLSLGDMQWVLRRPRDGVEVMLNVLVERKNVRDLAMSIMDGRFNECSNSDSSIAACGAWCIWWRARCAART